jgi:hypothetical protein
MTDLQPIYDPETLHEVYPDPDAVQARIRELRREIANAPDDTAELMARGELVGLLRGIGELDQALSQARVAVDRSILVGAPPQQHTARLRLAQVLQRRGEYVEADMLFIELVQAGGQYGPVIDAFTRQHAGTNDYDQSRYADAEWQFIQALVLREMFELPDDQIELSKQALAAARQRKKEAVQ